MYTAVTALVALTAWVVLRGGGDRTDAEPVHSTSVAHTQQAGASATARPTISHASPEQLDLDSASAKSQIAQLIAAAPAGGVSVAVKNLTTGASFSAGATSGMMCASVAKVQILESVLVQNNGPLSGDEDTLAQSMIENSDNDAADSLYSDLGGPTAFAQYMQPLGLTSPATTPGAPYYWGLTTTSAMQHLILLDNLVESSSPLSPASQAYMLNLMRNVESDQRWGVPEVADAGTTPANKNGWLNISDDDNLWAVNSDGVVTVHGQQLIMSVFTQHDNDMASGQQLVSQLVQALAETVIK